MAKITLGKRPEVVTSIVRFKDLDGSDVAIECQYKYRNKTEFGKLQDEVFEIKSLQAPDAPPIDGQAGVMQLGIERQAAYLQRLLAGWNLDLPLDSDNLVALCNETPGAALAIIEGYRLAMVEGRLGN